MADDKKGTVSIKMALEGVAKIERSIADIKAEFAGLGDEVRQIQTQFTSFSKGMNTVMSSAKSGFILGGFDKMKSNFKTNMSSFSRFATTALRGTLVGIGVTTASYIRDGIKKGLMLYPKLLTSQLSGIYNSVKSITGFDQFFSASGVLQGSIDLSQYAKQINAEAEQTGIATDAVMQYKLAMDMAGVSSDNFGKRISYLGKQLTKAYAGTAPDAMRVLKELRLEERELMNLPIEERFIRVAEAIDGLADPSKRAHAAMLLFERGGNLMLPLFRNMRGRIEQTKKVLGDLPLILKANSDEFTQFANNISLFSVKRQQFFAGFMQAGFADSGNSLMNSILEMDFTRYGKRLADMFENTLKTIKNGTLSDFIAAFADDFSSALKQGIQGLAGAAQKVDWAGIGFIVGKSMAETFWEISKDVGYATLKYIWDSIYTDNFSKDAKPTNQEREKLVPLMVEAIKSVASNEKLSDTARNNDVDSARSILVASMQQYPELGSTSRLSGIVRSLYNPKSMKLWSEALGIALEDSITPKNKQEDGSEAIEQVNALQEEITNNINARWQETLDQQEQNLINLQNNLFKVSVAKESIVNDWNTDSITKYDETIKQLYAQLSLKEQEFQNKILDTLRLKPLLRNRLRHLKMNTMK